jgi:hypothetical protein
VNMYLYNVDKKFIIFLLRFRSSQLLMEILHCVTKVEEECFYNLLHLHK